MIVLVYLPTKPVTHSESFSFHPRGGGFIMWEDGPSQEFIIDVFSGPLWRENHSKGLFYFCHLGCGSVTKDQSHQRPAAKRGTFWTIWHTKTRCFIRAHSKFVNWIFFLNVHLLSTGDGNLPEVRRNQDHLEVFQSPPRRQICRRGSSDLLA